MRIVSVEEMVHQHQVQLKDLKCSDSMERYRQSVPAFTYNAAVFPPYGDTIHHWYIRTVFPFRHVSLITDSKEEICELY